jgi:glycosyltransferase involved in cell wall biosynthesis
VFREILGDAALFVDPADTEALRAALRQAMAPDHAREAAERGPERAARYTWRACAQQLATLARAVARR